MKFVKHIFISYAHLDDKAPNAETKGWVAQFESSLDSFLSLALGKAPVIWRDVRELKGNVDFSAEIFAQFPVTALMISIVSERYLTSTSCLEEVREFCKIAEATGGLKIDNKLRVHQVRLFPFELARLKATLPEHVCDGLGYPFYKEAEDGTPMPLYPSFGPAYREAFNCEVYKLAFAMAGLLKKMEQGEGAPEPPGPPKATVYLAECSYDRREDREKIRGELQATGYHVLPEHEMPDLESEYIAEVHRLLDLCQISLHIVGSNKAKVPDGPGQKEVVQLQNEIAAKKCEECGLARVIWLPVAKSGQADHQAFIDALRSNAELQRGGDLVEDTLEGFKSAVRARLKKSEEPPRQKVEVEAEGRRLVYVICIANDRTATVPMRKFLREAGLDVKLPVFDGDAGTMRQANEELLARCDAVIVFYGAGDEAWKRTVDSDLQKSKGLRGGKPLLARLTYLAPPSTGDKADYIDMGESDLVNALETFPQKELSALVQTLKEAGK